MELLCIQTHSQKVVLAGQVYQLLDSKVNPCCKYKVVDVGFKPTGSTCTCTCGTEIPNRGKWWIAARYFIPIGTQDELENYKLSEPAMK